MSIRAELMKMGLRTLRWQQQSKNLSIEEVREAFERFGERARLPKDLTYVAGEWAGVSGEHIMQGDPERAGLLLYLHGGGYAFCSVATHRKAIGLLTAYLGFPAVAIDYALAPEHPYPAALDQAVAVYKDLHDINPDRPIVVAGDSAGGGLALALMIRLREEGYAMPEAGLLFSPWLDLSCSQDSYARNKKKDLLLGHSELEQYAKMYYQEEDACNPYISPFYAEVNDFPPILMQATDVEVFIDEIRIFRKKLKDAGVPVELEESKNLFHVWQLFSGAVPEGKKALRRAAQFVLKMRSNNL